MAQEAMATLAIQPEITGAVFLAPVDEVAAASMYLQLLHDGGLQELYYRGIPALAEFLGWLQRPDYAMVMALRQNVAGVEACGVGFLWDIKGPEGCRRADIGIAFLKRFQRRALTVPAARQFLEFAFEQVKLDAVFGTHAVEGRAGIALAQSLGFDLTPELPFYTHYHGKATSAVISSLTRGRFWQMGGKGRA